MDILKATESHFRALMDEHAFNINLCIQDQSREDCLEKLITHINRYNVAKNGHDTITTIKSQMQSTIKTQNSDQNEG